MQTYSRLQVVRRSVLVVSTLASFACGSGPPSRVDPPPAVDEDDWGDPPTAPEGGLDAESSPGLALAHMAVELKRTPLPADTCPGALDALRRAEFEASRQSEPFSAYVNRALALTFNDMLGDFWPAWISEVEAFATFQPREHFPDAETWKAYQCGHAFYTYLAPLADCYQREGTCSASPRILAGDVLAIAFAEPPAAIPTHCRATAIGPHPVAGLRATALQAARAVVEQLDPKWIDWMAREAAIHRLEAQVDRLCQGAEGPLDTAAVGQLDVAIQAAAEPLRDNATGVWLESQGQVRVPPAGPLTQVLVFEPGRGSSAARMMDVSANLPLHRR